MGTTNVTLIVKNPSNPKKSIVDEFLVDSGAVFTVLPQKIVEKLGLKPNFEQEFTLADGKLVKRKVGSALVEFQGRETASPVVLGKTNDSKLLGALTLEALGLALDPFQRKLYKAKLML